MRSNVFLSFCSEFVTPVKDAHMPVEFS